MSDVSLRRVDEVIRTATSSEGRNIYLCRLAGLGTTCWVELQHCSPDLQRAILEGKRKGPFTEAHTVTPPAEPLKQKQKHQKASQSRKSDHKHRQVGSTVQCRSISASCRREQ